MKLFVRCSYFIFLIFPLTSAWALAPRTELPRDFPVAPFFNLPAARAEKIAALLRDKKTGKDKRYVVLDFEANGQNPRTAKPIEIAALKFEGGKLIGKFYTLVDPGELLDPEVERITGLTDAKLRGQTSIDKAIARLAAFIDGCEIVGHSVSKYDVPLLETQLTRLGKLYRERPNVYDTKTLAQKLISRATVGRYRLIELAAHVGSPIEPNHSALADAIATTFLFWRLKEAEAAAKKNYSLHFQRYAAAMMEDLDTVLRYLQEDSHPGLDDGAPAEALVYLGNHKLEGLKKTAETYLKRGCRRLLVIADGSGNVNHELKPLAETTRAKLMQWGVPAGEIAIESTLYQSDEKLAFAASHFADLWPNGTGRLIVVDEGLSQKRVLLTLRKLQREKLFPEAVKVVFLTQHFLCSRHYQDKEETLFGLALKALSSIEALDYGAEKGWHLSTLIPSRVMYACLRLRRSFLPLEEEPLRLEEAI